MRAGIYGCGQGGEEDQLDCTEENEIEKILKAELVTMNKIKVNLSVPVTLLHDRKEGLRILSGEEEMEIDAIYFSEGGRPETTSSFEILLKEPLVLGKSYQVVKEGYGEKEILMSGVFSTSAFEKAYY